MQERDNLIRVLGEAVLAIKRDDSVYLKELSDQTIHSASIFKDSDNIIVAVIVYALSKIFERKNYRNFKQWDKFYSIVIKYLEMAYVALQDNNLKEFKNSLAVLIKETDSLSGDFKRQIKDVMVKAEINKAGKIYEHGLSMGQTANLLGISIWALAEYAGQRNIGGIDLGITMHESERMKKIMGLFER